MLLEEHGLAAALRDLADHVGVPVALSAPDGRFPPEIERCAWYTCSEAVANALKHARAARLEIVVRAAGGVVEVTVSDDGAGGADPARGSGLRRLAGRVEAAGGTLAIHSPAGEGTRIVARLPVRAAE